jgi:phosphosulfolactate phosphohydrolase-like enzyme
VAGLLYRGVADPRAQNCIRFIIGGVIIIDSRAAAEVALERFAAANRIAASLLRQERESIAVRRERERERTENTGNEGGTNLHP